MSEQLTASNGFPGGLEARGRGGQFVGRMSLVEWDEWGDV